MQRLQNNFFFLIILFFSQYGLIHAADNSASKALQIIQSSFDVKRSKDSLSRLTFNIKQKNKGETKLVFDQAWKEYAKGPYESKTIYFQSFPPDRQGIAYMGWFPREGERSKLEEWLYLPELRIVRRMGGNEVNNDQKTEDTFDRSEMKEIDLIPRKPGMDDHRYLRVEKMNGVRYNVIESTPKKIHHMNNMAEMKKGPHAHHHGGASGYPYKKVVRWIRQDNALPTRIDYFDLDGALLKRQTIQWQQIDDTWEWKKVVTRNLQNGNETRLDIGDLRINVGLKDRSFSKRMMKLGFNRIH